MGRGLIGALPVAHIPSWRRHGRHQALRRRGLGALPVSVEFVAEGRVARAVAIRFARRRERGSSTNPFLRAAPMRFEVSTGGDDVYGPFILVPHSLFGDLSP